MVRRRIAMVSVALALAVNLAAAESTAAQPAAANQNVFSLLPKSLQRRPRLELNVLSGLTPTGKTWPVPTAEKPVYYEIAPGINRDVGVGGERGLKTPPPEVLQRMLERALATNHFLRSAGPAQPPTLMILFHWGSSAFNSADFDTEMDQRRALLDRAMLLGGEKFTKALTTAIEELDIQTHLPPEIRAMQGNPIERLQEQSPEMNRLMTELFSSSYFVVATAFDHAAMAQDRGIVIWRTKMVVNSLGVNMEESLPPLIADAAPYLGRDTPSPVALTSQASREGRVEVGTPSVVEDHSPPAPARAGK